MQFCGKLHAGCPPTNNGNIHWCAAPVSLNNGMAEAFVKIIGFDHVVQEHAMFHNAGCAKVVGAAANGKYHCIIIQMPFFKQ